MARRNGDDRVAIDDLIGTVYDAAISATETCPWCAVLAKMCDAFKASAGSFAAHDLAARSGVLRHDYNISPDGRDAYGDGLAAANPSLNPQVMYDEGAVFRDEDVVSAGDMVRSDFYRGYLAPQGLLHGICGVIARGDREAYLVSLLRRPEDGPFDQKSKTALSELLPHLKRSINVRERVARERLARESLAEIMDLLPIAFLLVGRTGRVELCNRVATEMIESGDGLFVGAGGYLATSSQKHTADLRALIAGVASGRGFQANEHFIIPRAGGRLPLVCVLYPATGSRLSDHQCAEQAVALLVKDPQVERLDGLTDMVRAYELTNAEARLIKLLTAGQGLFEAAGDLGITKNTVRTHMRNIHSKIGTHGQADLMRVFAQFSMF